MGTVIVEPISSMLEFLTLWRFDPRWPFSDTDRVSTERIMPHVFEANRISRLVSLRRPMAGETPSDAAHPWALAGSEDGLLLEVTPSFVQLVQRDWPEWHGALLPMALRKSLVRCQPFKGRCVAVDVSDADGYRLLIAREVQPKDRLGKREAEVLGMYLAGRSYRQIAEQQERSTATVRNQLAQIYRKFGVHNKFELIRALQVIQPSPTPRIAAPIPAAPAPLPAAG